MNRKQKKACRDALQHLFGVQGYRPGQEAAASCLLSGRDLLCILPTGAGKSLCWQLPSVVHPGLTVIISPLIALMHDQVAGLRRRGIPAAAINSLMPLEERAAVEQAVRAGAMRILFVSPERLETGPFRRLMADCPPWLIVVDEAHCIVSWGAEFRPAYAAIGDFAASLPRRPVLCAMTATADVRMQKQIAENLRMVFHKRVMLPCVRENLHYSVLSTASCDTAILRLMRKSPCRTVIFCRKRSRTEALAGKLCQAGYPAEYYHAGLDRDARIAVQERFRSGKTLVLAATTAFGMGVDIPDIRRVIHDSLPADIIDLAQQSGRAGRDGLASECVVLLNPGDVLERGALIASLHRGLRRRPVLHARMARELWLPLRQLLRLILKEKCIPAGIARAFGQRARPCGRCSACLQGPLRKNAPDLLHLNERQQRLWFLEWQRSALAESRGVRPSDLATDQQLRMMAKRLVLPELEEMPDAETRQAMARVLRCMKDTQQ